MVFSLRAGQYANVAMPSDMKHTINTKYPESSKIWNSFSERHILFWTDSPQEEERVLRFARFGSLVSTVILALMGAVEFAFVALLLWQIVR